MRVDEGEIGTQLGSDNGLEEMHLVHNMHDSYPILPKKQLFQTTQGNTYNQNRPARPVKRMVVVFLDTVDSMITREQKPLSEIPNNSFSFVRYAV